METTDSKGEIGNWAKNHRQDLVQVMMALVEMKVAMRATEVRQGTHEQMRKCSKDKTLGLRDDLAGGRELGSTSRKVSPPKKEDISVQHFLGSTDHRLSVA
ncbi:hypothetical protein HAX54_022218 [Datura stramonium]|uniref:Uncharacterized protein n=1 Tax=Datura stramonium TaxID=4076 RepID=A0ABS8UV59_DATST|nr:hypothetical protein [Datura stramonium]